MAEYLSPDVFIEEIPSGLKPIEGVGTSTGAFIGHAEKGPFGVAIPINNFSQYVKHFGSFFDSGFLPFAVKGFFDEGGTGCYVVRTCHYAVPGGSPPGTPPSPAAVASFQVLQNTTPSDVLRVEALTAGEWGDAIGIVITHGGTDRLNIEVRYKGNSVERYLDLIMDASSADWIERRINEVSDYIKVTDQSTTLAVSVAARRPVPTTGTLFLASGDNGLVDSTTGVPITVTSDYVGDSALQNGIHALDIIDAVNLVAVPDAPGRDVHIQGMSYCQNRKDCFYIADSQQTIVIADDVVHYKLSQGAYSGGNAFNSTYGALYTPYVKVLDPRNGKPIAIPPSGLVAGRFAGVDSLRGVHKAAAGIIDGRLRSAVDVEFEFSDADQAKLNPLGIDVIRKISGVGNVLWGARTVSADPEWRYINVRRLFLFLEESILKATKWTVFEPNGPTLWKDIVRNVSAFLRIQWKAGALTGVKEEQAFFVKCDSETNPQESIDAGRVITEIGVAPSKPAEFVIFRISQFSGGSSIEE